MTDNRTAALSATPAPSDQDASQAQGEVERAAQHAVRCMNTMQPTIFVQVRRDELLTLVNAALSPAPGAAAQDGARVMHGCESCDGEDACTCREPTPTIPAGMVAVPRDPTAQMIEAYRTCHAQPANKHPTGHGWARDAWAAMLAAAPKQAEQQGVDPEMVERVAARLTNRDGSEETYRAQDWTHGKPMRLTTARALRARAAQHDHEVG